MYTIKSLKNINDFIDMESIEERVWGSPPIPVHQTFTASRNGGIILGAYDNGKMIGFLYSFPGFNKGLTYLCSHTLGILPNYQKSGLGHRMKELQRQIAIEEGYDLIVWTFDPLESVNAYLNINKLKGIGATYSGNHYGDMIDSLNQGIPTDRFLIEWWLHSEHVNNDTSHYNSPIIDLMKTKTNRNGFPVVEKIYIDKVFKNDEHYAVIIPENFQEMKHEDPELAYNWRMKTREVFEMLFSNGYVADGIKRKKDDKVCTYIFSKRDTLSL